MSPKDLAASVHARLANRARETGRPFQEPLQYYGMGRFLHRLSRSTSRMAGSPSRRWAERRPALMRPRRRVREYEKIDRVHLIPRCGGKIG